MPNVTAQLKRRIMTAYVKPGHPIAYSAPGRVAKYFNIKQAQAKHILEHIEGYTLHREYKQPKFYNPYYVHNRREQVQGDLIDVAKLSNENDGVKFLLLLIDIMTKKIWVLPLQSKSAANMRAAFVTWLGELQTKPKILKTDKGTEFTNRLVQTLLRERDIEWQAAFGTLKACIAERVNKTLQILIFKHLSENETLRYIDVLPNLVKTYNTRGHRTLEGLTPNEADLPANENRVIAIFRKRYQEAAKHRKTNLPFKVGDLVRIKTDPKKISSSSRAYAEQFKGEYFRIIRINRTLPIALYYLRSTDTGENIEGGFYANELQKLQGEMYKIERVLNRRTRNGRRELLVKWKYFGDRWNQWIPAADVARVF